MSLYTINRSRTVDWSQFIDLSSSPREGSAMSTKKLLEILYKQNKPADAFRPHPTPQRKRRQALVEEPEALQPRPKVVVTEQLRAQANARYTPTQAIAQWACENAVVRWVRREVGDRLVRNWAHFCTWVVQPVQPTQQQRDFAREMAVVRRRRALHRRKRTEEQLAAEIQISLAAARAALDSSPLAKPRPPPRVSRSSPPSSRLSLAEDHVYPEEPNLEGYREQWPGDSRRGEFGCEHCEERFEVARELRLHHVDVHLCMSGGAGPAGALEERGDDFEGMGAD